MIRARTGPEKTATFLAIEGATGAGKTTLATALSARLGAALALDPFDRNPFLTAYRQADPGHKDAFALPMEMTFLALRIEALRGIDQQLRRAVPVVADWALIKSHVFAAHTLGPDDVGRFSRTVNLWAAGLPVPDLVVYLHADAQTLAARVYGRGRGIDEGLEAGELARQDQMFPAILTQADLNVETVDASTFNVFSDADLAALTSRLPRSCPRSAA